MGEPINQPPAPGDPGTIPTAKQRIDAVLADRHPSVLSLADVEELMVRHHVAHSDAHSEMLEYWARSAERRLEAAQARVAELERELDQVSSDRYTEQLKREKAEARVAELERERDEARDVQEIPPPPLGRELGRSPIPTPRRQEREALLSIVRTSCEVDTVRKAALALLGGVQP